MFSIRRIYDAVLPVNQEAIRQAEEIILNRFAALEVSDVDGLSKKLMNPFKQKFRTILYVAERPQKAQVIGAAILMHDPDLNFCYLDFLATAKGVSSRGVGGALYEYVRDEARDFQAKGLFYECLPDSEQECPKPEGIYKENVSRLRFYERYGALPIANTQYQLPLKPGDTCMPFLVYDGLMPGKVLRKDYAKAAVKAILERKYGKVCPAGYIETVVNSFKDDPVKLREPRYNKKSASEDSSRKIGQTIREPIMLVVNDKHDIHHIKERGYVESPVRISNILDEISKTGLFKRVPPKDFPEKHIKYVHEAGFVEYIKKVCASLPEKKSVYPYVFPIRNATRPPKELSVRAGYYCIDTFTPINRNAYTAAKRGVNCTLTAADYLLRGEVLSYALVRPPGHHAERKLFGGFCYFNNAAIAARYLSRYGKIAILDIDYHHGNGQQQIFFDQNDVLTVSIHGHPNHAYPYFSGFASEKGEGPGKGFNLNFALGENINAEEYRRTLKDALNRIQKFQPMFLIVCLGFDTAKGDPTGSWNLTSRDFYLNGRVIGKLGIRTLIVQEGGYKTKTIGINARNFFTGLHEGYKEV
ncbi:MAG: acetylpolyamine amidohydrolase [Nitrospinota bacterium]|nr:acetylpolyamine amidohydrolase [Nitrospinota bacterium]